MLPENGTIEFVEGSGYEEEKSSITITKYSDGSLTITEFNAEGDIVSNNDYELCKVEENA